MKRWLLAVACWLVGAMLLRPSPVAAAPEAAASAQVRVSAEVRLKEQLVLVLHEARAGQTAQERARQATSALEGALDDPEAPRPRIEEQGRTAVLYVGKTPVVTLTEEDAAAAGEGVTLHVYAATVSSAVDDALRSERRRRTIGNQLAGVSFAVFAGLLAFLLFRQVGVFARSARGWLKDNPTRVPALRLGRIEVVRPATVRTALSVGLELAHRIAQFAVAYSALLIVLSQFDATKPYTDRLAGFVLAPISAFIGRLGAALPLVVLAIVAIVALGIAVRFVDLFFAGVARGETHVTWLPRDLAGPTSFLVRAGMVLSCIVLAAPLVTGTDDGALSRAGVVALAALGLACTPLLACAAVGVPAVFGRRLSPGDFVEVGGREGVVREMTLLEIVLEDAHGCVVRVPQLLGLWHPTRVLGASRPAEVLLVLDAAARPTTVEEIIAAAAGAVSDRVRVELVSVDAAGAHWRVSAVPRPGESNVVLADAVVTALQRAGHAPGGAVVPAMRREAGRA